MIDLTFEGRLLMNRHVNGPTHARTGPIIEGRDVIGEVEKFLWSDAPMWKRNGSADVCVYLGVEPAWHVRPASTDQISGPFRARHGIEDPYGVTTDELPVILVGDADLLKRLGEFDGHHVLLVVEKPGSVQEPDAS